MSTTPNLPPTFDEWFAAKSAGSTALFVFVIVADQAMELYKKENQS